MSTQEKEMRYREAARYIENATDILKTKGNKEGGYYQDTKYVKMACGTAYSGVFLAVDTYLDIKGASLEKKRNSRLSVKDYAVKLSQLDRKLLQEFNAAYNILHLSGYYDGITKYDVIRSGIDSAINILNKIKPAGLEGLRLAK
jgi:uncharacterized protein (UPF0332 family)